MTKDYPILVTIYNSTNFEETAYGVYDNKSILDVDFPKLDKNLMYNKIILKYDNLAELKNLIYGIENLTICTKNKETNSEGCALFLNVNGKIKVFEGNGDGSDDKEMLFKNFLRDYTYEIKLENETY